MTTSQAIVGAVIIAACFLIPFGFVAWDHRPLVLRYRVIDRRDGRVVFSSWSYRRAAAAYARNVEPYFYSPRPHPYLLEGKTR